MTAYTKFLYTLNLWSDSCEASFTEQRAIPKGPTADPYVEPSILHA